MSKNYEDLRSLLKNKEIIVTNTKSNKAAFDLAHVLRDMAKVTYCVDDTYKIKENQFGIRKIEEGKVFLIKGNMKLDKQRTLYKIRHFIDGANPKLIFNVEKI